MSLDGGRRDFIRGVTRRIFGTIERIGTDQSVLRPPGAVVDFLDVCSRCLKCAEVCPADAIHPLRQSQLQGTPVIRPSNQPCVVCDDLACMPACPTGALQIVAREDIKIGEAVVDGAACVRSRGEECQVCVDRCPIGETALTIGDEGMVVVGEACVGCGVCEYVCPTSPRAIKVKGLNR